MKIALYFGSFNPPHKGHVAIAEYVHKNYDFDEIHIVLSPKNPLKSDCLLLDDEKRKLLAEKWVEKEKYLYLSLIEFDMPRPSYTYVTLRKLRKENPYSEFSLILGMDSFLNLDKWKKYREILKYHKLYVYPRKDCTLSDVFLKSLNSDSNIILMQSPIFPYSSTEIREKIRTGFSVDYALPKEIADCIRENNFYR